MRVDSSCGGSSHGRGVGAEGRLLVLLVLLAKATISRLVDCPCHLVFAPMVGKIPLFLLLGIATFRWDLFPGLVLLLLSLVRSVLFVSLLTALLVLIFLFCDLSQLGVEFELALQRLDFSGHGHNFVVIRGLGPPLLRTHKPIVLGFGHL